MYTKMEIPVKPWLYEKAAVHSVSICVSERSQTFGNLAITGRQLPKVRGRSLTKQLTERTARAGQMFIKSGI